MYSTVRQEFQRMAELRAILAEHYASVAARPNLSPKVRGFLERLSDEERSLAHGIREFAGGRFRGLDTWVQFPAVLPVVDLPEPRDLEDVLELATHIDDALGELCRPLGSLGSSDVAEWCDSLSQTIVARERNRARVLALDE